MKRKILHTYITHSGVKVDLPAIPTKASEILKMALNDLIAIKKNPLYKIDMGDWHAPMPDKEICTVCFAGAVMARTNHVDSKLYFTFGYDGNLNKENTEEAKVLYNEWASVMSDLNSVRQVVTGHFNALCFQSLKDYEYPKWMMRGDYPYPIAPYYNHGTEDKAWIKWMRGLIKVCKANGN